MGSVRAAFIIFVVELMTGCASVPKSYDWNWVLVWNRAYSLEEKERAAALMPHHDYIRYHEQVIRNYVNPNLGSTPVYDLEREMVYFKLAAKYLDDWQRSGENAEKARVFARKLMELPNLHPMSKFLIARVQELDGGNYNSFYVPVPRGAKLWLFTSMPSNDKREFDFGNFEQEYDRILHEKEGGYLGKGTQLACGAVLLCITGVSSNDDLVIRDLRQNVYLDVIGADGKPVQIGVSSWTRVAKSQ